MKVAAARRWRRVWAGWRGLRAQLMLVSLTVLAIPWLGLHFVQEVEAFLRRAEERSALALAQAVGAVLNDRAELFRTPPATVAEAAWADRVQPFALAEPIRLDGRTGDWEPVLEWAPRIPGRPADALGRADPAADPDPRFTARFLAGRDRRGLHLLFVVSDETVVYRTPSRSRLTKNDHLRFDFQGADGRLKHYLLGATGPGLTETHLLDSDRPTPSPIHLESAIRGYWRPTPEGYDLEVRIPAALLGPDPRVDLRLVDVDDPDRPRVGSVIALRVGGGEDRALGALQARSREVERILAGLRRERERIRILDPHQTPLAVTGTLARPAPPDQGQGGQRGSGGLGDPGMRTVPAGVLGTLTDWLLPPPARRFGQPEEAIQQALLGLPQVYWRPGDQAGGTILAAAQPVFGAGEQVLGAVVVERSGAAVLAFQERAVENLIQVTLPVFGAAALALLLFATVLSVRIRRLRDHAAGAVDANGRILGEIPESRWGDELGELSRSFAELLQHLAGYNGYLERLGSRLSHELRTPLAVVQSSLDNLEAEYNDRRQRTSGRTAASAGMAASEGMVKKSGEAVGEDDPERVYLERAREGAGRLGRLLASLSEAARLEQSLEGLESEPFDLVHVVAGCVTGCQGIHENALFAFDAPAGPLPMIGSPDAIAQMLDKLVSNAVDFANPGAPIQVALAHEGGGALLTVANQGPPLPEGDPERLFDSMVSIRARRDGPPHLGLGLHIVRLVARRHGGRAWAANREEAPGARFQVWLPLAS